MMKKALEGVAAAIAFIWLLGAAAIFAGLFLGLAVRAFRWMAG